MIYSQYQTSISNKIFADSIKRFDTKLAPNWFTFKKVRCFRNFYSSHSPSSFLVASSRSIVHPTYFSHLFSWIFFCPRPFSPAPVVSINCLLISSSSATMNSSKTMKSISTQTNQTVSSYNSHSLEAAIFKTLALKLGNELNHCTISPSTRQAFFKNMYNDFLISTKKIHFEQYYRLRVSRPTIAICETKSSNVFVLSHISFDQNNFYFLHAVREAVDAFNAVMNDFGIFQKLAPYDPSKHPTQPQPSSHLQNFQPGLLTTSIFAVFACLQLVCCAIFFFAVFAHPQLVCCTTSIFAVFAHHQLLFAASLPIFNLKSPSGTRFALLQILRHELLPCSITGTISNFILL